jgi:hypothetical protein
MPNPGKVQQEEVMFGLWSMPNQGSAKTKRVKMHLDCIWGPNVTKFLFHQNISNT